MAQTSFIPWSANSSGAQAINRAAAILRILAVNGAHGIGVGEVAQVAGLARSTALRLLSALADEGLAERASDSRLYRLGQEIFGLGAAAGAKHDLRSLARPSLERISSAFGHTAHLFVRIGFDAICLDQSSAGAQSAGLGGPGSRVPLGVSSHGVALLAFLNGDEIRDIMARNMPRRGACRVYHRAHSAGLGPD